MPWQIVSGPRTFDELGGFDMDVGWAYDIERGAERRTISVIVAGGRRNSKELPDESVRAVRSRGRSAVQGVLDRDAPPRYISVTTGGLGERAE